MRSSFFGFNVAVRGLFAAERNLDVINHNLNNITTSGYSRQQGIQQTARPIALCDGTGMVGTGAEVNSVQRIRDEFLDYKYWSENDANGEWSAKQEMISDIEVTFNEPSQEGEAGSGFTKIMNDFYDSLQELAKNPSDLSTRAVVRQNAVTLTKYFNSTASHFEKLQQDLNYRIKTKVEEVNSIASQIAELNRQIYTSELDGNTANDLRDRRGVLVDNLSKLVNIQANEVVVGKLPNGKENIYFEITVGGRTLVNHCDVTKLKTEQRATGSELNAGIDVSGLYDIKWEDNNSVNIKSGELKGYLDVRDGNSGVNGSPQYKGIPYYIGKLNDFVRTFAEAFDKGINPGEGHYNGFGLNGAANNNFFTMVDPNTGTRLDTATFDSASYTYSAMTAKNFAVSADVMDNLDNIAASDTSGGQVENSDMLQKLIDMRHDASMFTDGTPEDFMKSLIVDVGIDSQQAKMLYGNQDNIVKLIDKQRTSISGVSEDEEMANLVKFQNTYNACAKMITTMVEIYDTLINKTGVG